MTHETRLGPGAEFDAIRRILARLGEDAEGIGDDAAMLSIPRGEQLVVSTDSAVENRHFRQGWLSATEIGYRAVAAALSDLAAMAARPLGVLTSFGIPRDRAGIVDELADGIRQCVADAGTVVRGGNVTASDELWVTTTVLGSAFTPVRRSGAQPGDLVYVTGSLGGPVLAFRSYAATGEGGVHRERFAHPRPRLHEAQWLAARGARAAIDISDGLVADARHMAAASGVVVELRSADIPRVEGAEVADALTSGEEYELLLAASSRIDTAEFAARFGVPLSEIGVIGARASEPQITIDGERVADVKGHDHFSR